MHLRTQNRETSLNASAYLRKHDQDCQLPDHRAGPGRVGDSHVPVFEYCRLRRISDHLRPRQITCICRIALFSTAYRSSSWARPIEAYGTELNLGDSDSYNFDYIYKS